MGVIGQQNDVNSDQFNANATNAREFYLKLIYDLQAILLNFVDFFLNLSQLLNSRQNFHINCIE